MRSLALFALAALTLPASAVTSRAYQIRFELADVNNDERLNLDEFLATQPRRSRWTDVVYRFNAADEDGNGSISLVEFAASRGGRLGGRPRPHETFALADQDLDGFLDPSEFALTGPDSWSWTINLRIFDRKDRDDDGLISPREFGIRTTALLSLLR